MLRTGFLAVLHFIYGFCLRMIQGLELLVAKIELDIVQIFSGRFFLKKQPGGIQHSDKDYLHQKNRQMRSTGDLGGRGLVQAIAEEDWR